MDKENQMKALRKASETTISGESVHAIYNSINKASSAIHYYRRVLDESNKTSETDLVVDALSQSIEEITQKLNEAAGVKKSAD